VRLDVLRGFISLDAARVDYGVAMRGEADSHEINPEETAKLREARPATRLFHRDTYLDRV